MPETVSNAPAQAAALTAVREERGARASLRAGVAAVAVLLVALMYVLSYRRVWQALVPLCCAAVSSVCLLRMRQALGRSHLERAWTWLATAALLAYGSLELAFTGVSISVALGGLLVLLRIIGAGQRLAAGRGIIFALVFAALMGVVSVFEVLPRYDIGRLPILLYVVNVVTGSLGLGALWHYLQSFREAHAIRVRMLVAFMLTALVPAGTVAVTSAILTYNNDRDRITAHLQSVVALKEAEVSAWVQDRAIDLRLLCDGEDAALRAVLEDAEVELPRARLHAVFRLHIADAMQFDELFLMDPWGRIVVSSNPRSEGEYRGMQQYFREGRERPGMFVQTLSFSSISESLNTVIAVDPVRDAKGTVVGVMAGRGSLAKLNEIMRERAGLGETGETYLVGNNHVLLTESRFPGYGVGKTYLTTEGVQAAIDDKRDGHSLYSDYRNEPVLGVYRWLPALRVGLLGEIDQSEALRPARLMMTVNIKVGAVAMLVAALASILFARSIAAPVASLAQTATRIAAGERNLVAIIERPDEIGALAEAFNHMTADLQRSIKTLQARERALGVSQQQLQAMMDNSTALISIKDAEGRVLLVNRRFEEVLKVARDRVVNKTDLELFPEELAERFRAADRLVLESGAPREWEETLDLDDGQHTYLTMKYPLHNTEGTVYAVCGISTDITERKRAEDALRRERDLLARVMATSPAGITVVERTGAISFANLRAETVLGLSRSEITTRNYDDPAWRITDFEGRPLPPESLPFQRVYKTRQAVSGVRHAIEWSDGRRILLSVNAAPLFDAKGEFDAMIASVEDITARVGAEIALREAHDELETRVAARTRELAEAQMELVATARRAGMAEIATNVLHNVGNVLNSVNTSATLLGERIRDSRGHLLVHVSRMLDEHQGNLADFLTRDPKGQKLPTLLSHLSQSLTEERARHEQDIESLTRNIAHIKTIVQLQQSYAGFSDVAEKTSLAELLEDAVRINLASPLACPIHIDRDYEELPPLVVEKHKILQILVNLVGNAKHALLEAPSSDKRMMLRLYRHGETAVRVEVEDNGVGIAEENLTRIFQHGFTTRKDGHGFGLHSGALSASELGGSLSARSAGPGRGAVFVLEFKALEFKTSVCSA